MVPSGSLSDKRDGDSSSWGRRLSEMNWPINHLERAEQLQMQQQQDQDSRFAPSEFTSSGVPDSGTAQLHDSSYQSLPNHPVSHPALAQPTYQYQQPPRPPASQSLGYSAPSFNNDSNLNPGAEQPPPQLARDPGQAQHLFYYPSQPSYDQSSRPSTSQTVVFEPLYQSPHSSTSNQTTPSARDSWSGEVVQHSVFAPVAVPTFETSPPPQHHQYQTHQHRFPSIGTQPGQLASYDSANPAAPERRKTQGEEELSEMSKWNDLPQVVYHENTTSGTQVHEFSPLSGQGQWTSVDSTTSTLPPPPTSVPHPQANFYGSSTSHFPPPPPFGFPNLYSQPLPPFQHHHSLPPPRHYHPYDPSSFSHASTSTLPYLPPQTSFSNNYFNELFPFDESLITPPRPHPHPQRPPIINQGSYTSTYSHHSASGEYESPPRDSVITTSTRASPSKRGKKSSISVPPSNPAPHASPDDQNDEDFGEEHPSVSPPVDTNNNKSNSPGKKSNKKETIETTCECTICGVLIAKLILRGLKEDFEVAYSPLYTCSKCAEANPPTSTSHVGDGDPSALTQTLRASKPRHQPSSTSVFRKRSKRPDLFTPCDVCLKVIGAGQVVAQDSKNEVDFAVEVICASCADKYLRCTDCGGGGGHRLGVGKWRSKELFADSRKTCSLSHTRLGSLSDMIYDVRSIQSIPEDELEEVVSQCKGIFLNTMLGGMCIPEVIETRNAVVFSYDDIVSMSATGWRSLEPLLRYNVETPKNIRRYLAVRSCTRNPRKGNRSKLALPPPDPRKYTDGGVLMPGKTIAGFIESEYDFARGTLFLAVVVPWATGDTYDATTLLMQKLLRQVEVDRTEFNSVRALHQLPPLPELGSMWTMMFFARESRMMYHLQKKRGFMPLDEYLQKYPDTDPQAFPPHREVYLPVQYQQGWSVLVRRQSGATAIDDWTPKKSLPDVDGNVREQRPIPRAR